MTHTLETTGIARVVARALRLNEDLTEAIGLGHDTGHPPFGHAGEAALDELLRDRGGFRHNEQSARIAEALNLTREVIDGIFTHTGPREPTTLEGKIVRIVDRVAYINHDIDDAIRYGILEEGDLPRDEIALLGPTGGQRIDTLVHDLVETLRRRRRHRPERRDRRGDALAPLVHVRPRLSRAGDAPRARAREGRRSVEIFEHGASVEFIAGMTDRFALSYAERTLVARIKDSSVEAVKAAADLVAVVEERTSLRKQGARLVGRCPFHEERTPSFSVNPSLGLYHCFGCHKGGDVIRFVRETQGLDFAGAIEWLAERFRIDLEYEDVSPEQAAKRNRRARLHELLDDAATYYERHSGRPRSDRSRATTSRAAASARPIAREFRLGLSLGGDALSRKALAKGFTRDELQAAGLMRRRGRDAFQRRLMFPLTDARGRVLGFQARKLHDDDPLAGKYVNTQESELFHKSAVVYGLDKARSAIAKQDRACVVEGNADVIALRQAGFEPVVACMGTSLTEQQLRELGRLTKRLWLAFDGDAAGESAALRGMELAVAQRFDVNVVALPPGVDPADDPAGFEAHLRGAEPYVVYRVRLELDHADDREAGFRRAKEILDGFPEGPDKLAAQRLVTDRVGTTVQFRTGAIPSARAAANAPRVVDAGTRLERNALAGALAHEELRPLLGQLTPEHFYDPTSTGGSASTSSTGAPLDSDAVALLAELDARAEAEGIDVATGEELLWRLRERRAAARAAGSRRRATRELQEMLRKLFERVSALSGR